MWKKAIAIAVIAGLTLVGCTANANAGNNPQNRNGSQSSASASASDQSTNNTGPGGPGANQGGFGTPTLSGTLTEQELAELSFAREEERMARDLYAAFNELYNTNPFININKSEQQHHDAAGAMLEQAGAADPSAGLAEGTFAYPELQKLYDDWLAQGKESLKDALKASMELEERDIKDLEQSIAKTTNPSLVTLFENLKSGSENHLQAFTKAYERQ